MKIMIEQITDAKSPHMDAVREWNRAWWGADLPSFDRYMDNSVFADRIPQTFVALLDGKAVGTYGLHMNDNLDARPDLYPWFVNLWVDEKFRKHGVCRAIMESVPAQMRKLGLETLYLWTPHEKLFEKFGWEYIGDETFWRADNDYNGKVVHLYRLEAK